MTRGPTLRKSLRRCGKDGDAIGRESMMPRGQPSLITTPICYRNHHLRRHDIKMEDIRGSLSKMKKRIKHRLTGKKPEVDKARDGGGGVGDESSGSLPPQAVTSDHSEREGNEPSADDKSVGPSTAADESESDWKATTSASAKLLLRGVSNSSDAFGPLKSVAGGLCFILENCEVWSRPRMMSAMLNGPAAYEGEQASDRVVGTQGQDAQ